MSEAKKSAIQTTGQLREFLSMAILGVKNGDLAIDRASQIHKLAGHINDSLYSEAKIAAFVAQAGGIPPSLGAMPIGVTEINQQALLAKK